MTFDLFGKTCIATYFAIRGGFAWEIIKVVAARRVSVAAKIGLIRTWGELAKEPLADPRVQFWYCQGGNAEPIISKFEDASVVGDWKSTAKQMVIKLRARHGA